jgi:hypothetical protein
MHGYVIIDAGTAGNRGSISPNGMAMTPDNASLIVVD